MFTLGVPEMAVIFILALVLFGPKKLPELGRTIGKAITEFRRASNDLKSTFDREMQNLERETESVRDATHSIAGEIHSQVVQDFSYDDSHNVLSPNEPTATNPSTVDASAVSGVESHGTEPDGPAPAAPALEGTVARSEVSHAEAAPAVHPAVDPDVTPELAISGTQPAHGTDQHA